MRLAELTAAVEEHFRADADRYRLDPEKVSATYVLNPGGFVNASFTVTDGDVSYHLKLSLGPHEIGTLWRWFGLRAPLATRYHAPPVVAWIALADTHAEGLLFPHLERVPADVARDPGLLTDVVATLDALHGDEELAASLGAPVPARASLLDTFVERFTSDLDEVLLAEVPPFVDDGTFAWMRGETARLADDVARDAAFDVACASPVHGDPWPHNVLVAGDRWYLTDWDDLRIGDPALDLAILTWPLVRAGLEPDLGARDDAFRARLATYARANLLDEVIDSLADWVEAEAAPAHRDAVRAEKEALHREALERYRARY